MSYNRFSWVRQNCHNTIEIIGCQLLTRDISYCKLGNVTLSSVQCPSYLRLNALNGMSNPTTIAGRARHLPPSAQFARPATWHHTKNTFIFSIYIYVSFLLAYWLYVNCIPIGILQLCCSRNAARCYASCKLTKNIYKYIENKPESRRNSRLLTK